MSTTDAPRSDAHPADAAHLAWAPTARPVDPDAPSGLPPGLSPRGRHGTDRSAGPTHPAGDFGPEQVGAPRPRRGRIELTPLGTVVVLLVVGLAGIAVDLSASGGVGLAFGATFTLATAAAAWLVRRSDRFVPLVATPLVYAALATVGGAGGSGNTGGRSGLVVGSLAAVITAAPVLIAAFGVCLVVTALRLGRER